MHSGASRTAVEASARERADQAAASRLHSCCAPLLRRAVGAHGELDLGVGDDRGKALAECRAHPLLVNVMRDRALAAAALVRLFEEAPDRFAGGQAPYGALAPAELLVTFLKPPI